MQEVGHRAGEATTLSNIDAVNGVADLEYDLPPKFSRGHSGIAATQRVSGIAPTGHSGIAATQRVSGIAIASESYLNSATPSIQQKSTAKQNKYPASF